MTLTFLELYNTAASQEWSMYDNDAGSSEEFEKSLVIDLNKAVKEILYSYPFGFRERTHIHLTVNGRKSYELPQGLIMKDKFHNYCVKLNSKPLKLIENTANLGNETGTPEGFYIDKGEICLYPIPIEKGILTIDYLTLAVGENKNGDNIFTLKDEDDALLVPDYLAEIFKEAVISRTMLNVIASESDENYSAYKKQSETAYRLLVKYSKGVDSDKTVLI